MSFQGDVAGIGLGELLQGLARGERNGILTLTGKRLSASVGLRRGQVYLLQGPDEDESIWRDRTLRAFADDPNPNLEGARRAVIARASRLETFYRIMEAGNLHFRFDPGQLPPAPGAGIRPGHRSIQFDSGADQEQQEEENPAWGTGMPVEYLLLEHARISDEVRMGMGAQVLEHDVPRAQDPHRQENEVRDFLEHCNGHSTAQEISDRLGWPLSKCRGVLGEYLQAGQVRLAQARELLAAAQREMELGRPGRAASRLTGWLRRSESGQLSPADAQLLLTEWSRERLQKTLAVLEPRDARAVLRRLDRMESDKKAIHERWRVLADAHRQDEAILLHELSLRLASSDPNSRTFADLLRLAHSFHQRGHALRTRTLLRLCANQLPEGGPIRVELGRRMLEAGLVAEGGRWLLNTAREFLAAKDGEAAMLPIRAILRVLPEHEEALAMLEEAQVVQIQTKRRRVGLSVGLSMLVALSAVAAVKYREFRSAEEWIASVDLDKPAETLLKLDLEYGAEPPARIVALRERLRHDSAEEMRRTLEDWTRRYREAEEACRFGDPVLGFTKALELPAPPHGSPKQTPDTSDLLGQLAARLSEDASKLDLPPDAPIDRLNEEERLLDLLEEFQKLMQDPKLPPQAHSFRFKIGELTDEVRARRSERATKREMALAKEKEKDQDILLATARAHDQAGDLERALAAYDRLLESDPSLKLIPELQQEIDRVRAHHRAFEQAVKLCNEGRHAEAEKVLRPLCPRPIEHLMPFKVESLPSGARVTLSDGRVRTTPFTGKSGFGEEVTLTFSLPGFEERTIQINRPTDLLVALSLFPERVWVESSKVDAVPVPSGDDHIVCDRRGRIARLDASSQTRWEKELKTLSGVARTPVFLPNRSGWLLVISEEGKVWLVQAQSGEVEGPREIGSPPVVGPELTRGGVSVQFNDGRVALWTDRLEPTFYKADGIVATPGNRDDPDASSMTVLRRGMTSAKTLVSPSNGWSVEVAQSEYRVIDPDGNGFSAKRTGEWNFIAWEPPKALIPHGRLWVSDEGGLRSYVPSLESMVPYPGSR